MMGFGKLPREPGAMEPLAPLGELSGSGPQSELGPQGRRDPRVQLKAPPDPEVNQVPVFKGLRGLKV